MYLARSNVEEQWQDNLTFALLTQLAPLRHEGEHIAK